MSVSTGSSASARLRAFCERHRRALPLAVVAVAVIAHGQFILTTSTSHLRWDSAQYIASGKSLAAGHGFRDDAGAIEARRTPAYPLFIAPFLYEGSHIEAIVIAQHLLSIALAAAVYFVTLGITGDILAAAVAGFFVAVDGGQIYMADIVMTETLMSVVLVAFVALLARFARRPSIAVAAAAGVLVAVAALVRPNAMYLWIPLLVWIIAAFRPRRLLAAAAFAVATLAVLLLWIGRNYAATGSATFSSITGEITYYWRAAGAVAMEKSGFSFVPGPFGGEEAFRKQFFRVTQRQFAVAAAAAHLRAFGARAATMPEAKLSEFDGRMGWRILRAHLRGAVLVTIFGALHLLFDSTWEYASALYGGWAYVISVTLMFAFSVATVVLTVVGFIRLRRRNAPAAWLIVVVLAYHVAILSGP